MAVDTNAVRSAVEAVMEPEMERTLGDLGLIRSIEAGRRSVEIAAAFPAPHYPDPDGLRTAIVTAAGTVSGVSKVDVTFDVLNEAEQVALRERLIGDPASTAGQTDSHGHAEGRAIPFASPDNNTRVLLIASGKGGVGKSSVTVNLAAALAQRGRSVAIVDADVWGFSIPKMLGISRPPLLVDKMLVPPRAHGVRCISMGFFTADDQAVIWRGPMLHKWVEQVLTDVWWDEPDYLLVDLPPGTGDISLSLAQFLPRGEVVVVTTPQPAAQRVAQRAGIMADKVNLQTAGVIENMSYFQAPDGERYEIFGAGGGEQLATKLDVPLLGSVPLTMDLRAGGDDGVPLVVSDPDSAPGKVFADIAGWFEDNGPRRRYRSELKIV